MADIQYATLTIIPAIAAGLYFLLHRWRYNTFAHIPTPLSSNLFIGHLGYVAEGYKKYGDAATHPGKCLHTRSPQDVPTDVA
jgi:hypothetical protein